MKYEKSNLKQITVIRTGKLDSNAAVPNGLYPFFTCDPTTLRINTWAYYWQVIMQVEIIQQNIIKDSSMPISVHT